MDAIAYRYLQQDPIQVHPKCMQHFATNQPKQKINNAGTYQTIVSSTTLWVTGCGGFSFSWFIWMAESQGPSAREQPTAMHAFATHFWPYIYTDREREQYTFSCLPLPCRDGISTSFGASCLELSPLLMQCLDPHLYTSLIIKTTLFSPTSTSASLKESRFRWHDYFTQNFPSPGINW